VITCCGRLFHTRDVATGNDRALGVRGADTRAHPPPTVDAIEWLNKLTVLGVVINDRLSADNNVTATIAVCSKSLYALRVLRSHGMSTLALHSVYRATVVSKLIYCSPACSGFCIAASKIEIESTPSSSSKRSGYCADEVQTVNELFADADKSLLDRDRINSFIKRSKRKQVLANQNHTLHQFLPPINSHDHHLRKRPNYHQLPTKRRILQQWNFIIRSLFNDTY